VNFVAIETDSKLVFFWNRWSKGMPKIMIIIKTLKHFEKLTIFFFGLLAQLNGLLVSRWRWFRNKTGSFSKAPRMCQNSISFPNPTFSSKTNKVFRQNFPNFPRNRTDLTAHLTINLRNFQQ